PGGSTSVTAHSSGTGRGRSTRRAGRPARAAGSGPGTPWRYTTKGWPAGGAPATAGASAPPTGRTPSPGTGLRKPPTGAGPGRPSSAATTDVLPVPGAPATTTVGTAVTGAAAGARSTPDVMRRLPTEKTVAARHHR